MHTYNPVTLGVEFGKMPQSRLVKPSQRHRALSRVVHFSHCLETAKLSHVWQIQRSRISSWLIALITARTIPIACKFG